MGVGVLKASRDRLMIERASERRGDHPISGIAQFVELAAVRKVDDGRRLARGGQQFGTAPGAGARPCPP